MLDESLVQIEQEFPRRFLRLHRNCLVALAAVAGVERAAERDGAKDGEREAEPHWEVLLRGLPERLPVSRRQWPAVQAGARPVGRLSRCCAAPRRCR